MLTGVVASAHADVMDRTDRLRLDALTAAGVAANQLRTAETDLEAAVARALH